MRFRKRVKVFPGFYLNFSGSGVSSTIGTKGASINFSKKGAYLNTGIPGTGLYNRQRIGNDQDDIPVPREPEIELSNPAVGEIKSAEKELLTSASLTELKESVHEAYNDRIELTSEIEKTKKEIKSAKTNRIIACIFIVGLFIKSLKSKIVEKEEYLVDLQNQLQLCFVNIDIHFDKSLEKEYEKVVSNYNSLLTTQIIWDITASFEQDRKLTRSAATTVQTRVPVSFSFENIDIIKSSYQAFHFENKNGGDLYIYPAFVIITSDKKEFALIDIKEFEMNFKESRFMEEEIIPSDTKIIDTTWAKVNKNGEPDRRFKGNYEIPIVRYGQLHLNSNSGLNESYAFSNFEKSETFFETFASYKNLF
ncbi:MAG: DUF4236 domain-containing protein [Bacteroidota bacterium]